jgi:hypothetical protein
MKFFNVEEPRPPVYPHITSEKDLYEWRVAWFAWRAKENNYKSKGEQNHEPE